MQRAKIITELDNLDYLDELRKQRVCVVGYGNQGRSQALNMRDSGLEVIVANKNDEYAKKAREENFDVYDIAEGTRISDVIFMLIPDEVQKEVFQNEVSKNLRSGSTIVFASAYNYYFGFVRPRNDVDVLLIAPRMIGPSVRELYIQGKGFPVLAAVGNDYSGRAEQRMLALCYSIGALKQGGAVLLSSFREETLIDLLTEQTWAGALLYFFRAYYETATKFGASPEAVILELYGSGELEETARAMKEIGLFKQLGHHSRTSQYGQLTRGRLFVNREVKKLMNSIARQILDGTFANEWERQRKNTEKLEKLYKKATTHEMEQREEELYRMLGRKEGRDKLLNV